MDQAADATAGARQSKRLQLVQPSSDSDSEGGSGHDTTRQQKQQQQSPPPTQQARPVGQLQSPQLQQTPSKSQKSSEQQQEQQQSNQLHKTTSATHNRNKPQKHVVGGGGSTARLHARVPSSKALHKTVHHHHHGHGHHSSNHLHHVSSSSSTKINQQPQQAFHLRQSPTSPTLSAAEYAARFPFAAVPPPIERQQQPQQQQQAQRPQPHRRWTSIADGKLPRNTNASTASSVMRRNVSATNLKRNQSHADVGKRTSSGGTKSGTGNAHLKRISSNPAVSSDRPRPLSSAGEKRSHGGGGGAGRVHFEIGSSDEQEDDWVDAGSSNVSGSRKGSLQHSHEGTPNKTDKDTTEGATQDDTGESDSESDSESESEEEETNNDTEVKEGTHDRYEDAKLKQVKLPIRSASASRQSPEAQQHLPKSPLSERHDSVPEQPQPSSSASTVASGHRRTASAVRLLLPHTSPSGAPPKVSPETASATRTMQISPGSSPPRRLPDRHQQNQPGGSDGRLAMTSRFITTSKNDAASGTTGGESFYTSSSQPSIGRPPDTERDPANGLNSAVTFSDLVAEQTHPRRARSIGGETFSQQVAGNGEGLSTMSNGGDRRTSAVSAGGNGGTNPRRTRAAPPAELSRTQQKLNLERASSNIDRGNRQHTVPATGSLVGAGEFGMHDPRIGKLMEKTGMEYYMIRRYQNPVMRSLNRLSGRLGGDRNWRIPSAAANGGISRSSTGLARASRPSGHGHTATRSLGGGGSDLSPSFHERDVRRGVLQSATAAAATSLANPPNPPNGAASRPGKPYILNSSDSAAGEPSARASFQPQQQQQRLSGASLVEDYDADSTATILRNLWDKSLYLGTSQD
ncbi:hypothetical protein SEPCBS57363_004136 [Sporothrix epigloea]|uniref:Uncharacterized protein n=1 Tax=Sporothrix epigloea TaxID=1892477 RepID=A0ABP0DS80_9PEZI